MLLGTRKTLFDHIIEALLEKAYSVTELDALLKKNNVHVTVQGIYKTLRELMSDDIVVKQKTRYSVNNVWRGKLEKIVSQRSLFLLTPGEEVVYKFQKLEHLDAFWKHTLSDIEQQSNHFPVFHFTPHQFWSYVPGRAESESEYYRDLAREHTHVYTLIGGDTLLDRKAQRLLKNDSHQVHLDPGISFNRRDHVSAIGDYVITTRIMVGLAKLIDDDYSAINHEPELVARLIPYFKKYGAVKLTIEHNTEKAKKLRKRLSADFHISREVRERFDLF